MAPENVRPKADSFIAGRLFLTVLTLMLLACQAPVRTDRPYVILVSIDGFRHDFQGATMTPALDWIAANGVRAAAMRPVFPAMTFPNHYSIATGLYPFEHGIVDNSFPDDERERWYSISDRSTVSDGSWYGGEPIWVTAEKNGVTSAAFFFVGTEAAVQGISPSYWYPFDGSIPGEDRVRQVLDWLQLPLSERPHFISLYFEDVDEATHDYGPGSPQSRQAIRLVDGFLRQLQEGIARLDVAERVYTVVVSDHGQTRLRADIPPFVLSDHVSLAGLTIYDHTSYVALYLDSADARRAVALRDAINANWHNGRAFVRAGVPAEWRVTDNPRFADVFAVADPGYAVISAPGRRVKPGNHGYAPSSPEMHGIFLAHGPRLAAGVRLDEVHAVGVYPLLVEMLGLPLPSGYVTKHEDLRELLRGAANNTD